MEPGDALRCVRHGTASPNIREPHANAGRHLKNVIELLDPNNVWQPCVSWCQMYNRRDRGGVPPREAGGNFKFLLTSQPSDPPLVRGLR
eukprot:10516886-Heterocapsa_arctica.AAC.1